ncbi:trafficking kinesin-binding 1 isoform X1 [Brachionus plicatilis]|uniref:Trafficking kinesin-binding 1 isoform X1 n=1 Tax=Brachionus plicatilis TaxID=10195 RepID=A0A3M7T759_BRAPC|nr:trafficking kinesin-binding 1 isoform X1 [Brachionus plicatilis]
MFFFCFFFRVIFWNVALIIDDYSIIFGYRVSQMTKTYYDIEAVTKLLDEKERDLELAATIGKQLLEKDQQLEEKIEFLEQELVKTNDMSFIDSEQDVILEESSAEYMKASNNEHIFTSKRINEINFETLNEYKRKIEYLEEENDQLRNKADYFEKETADLEFKESSLITNCFKEIEESQEALRHTQNELKNKTNECFNQQEEINSLFGQFGECNMAQHLELHQLFKSANHVQNLCKTHCALKH